MAASAETLFQPIERWFAARGWRPFPFQRRTWEAYLRGESGLVHAATGTGKTLAVWLGPVMEALASPAISSHPVEGAPSLRVLWLTPLRALANDTAQNLRTALHALNLDWRIELRTGDTAAGIRRRQRTQMPEALITTPESLCVMLSYPGSSAHFSALRCIIVDEWHELMGTKRGTQAELAMARLRALSPRARTWGLSATLGNIDQAMRVLLGGTQDSGAGHPVGTLIRGEEPKATVVDTIRPPDIDRFPWSGHIGTGLLPDVIRAIEGTPESRSSSKCDCSTGTTLLFTNVRSQAEIWFRQILKARPDLIGQVALHHGSIDRDIRAQVEQLLREGRVKCVVCTSSLDLGVDFSPVDQVMQLGSPKGIARMMQRAGRSGHQPGAVSRILGVPTNALELVEFAAARQAVQGADEGSAGEGDGPEVESRTPLERPLDVLLQHLVTISCGDGFVADQMRDEVRGTHAFRNLTDAEWSWALDFVMQGGRALTAYPQYSRIRAVEGRCVVADRSIERMHRMSIGTITSDAAVKVAYLNGASLGTIEESFITRLNAGDRFVFGGRVLELIELRNMVAHVRNARQSSGIVPRWMGGRSPLSTLLSQAIRRTLEEARRGRFDSPEMQLVRPLLELQARWSLIPAPDELLIERCQTRAGHHLFIFPFDGRLVHEGLSSLVAHRIASQEPRSITVTANDYGFELLSRAAIELAEDEWRAVLSPDDLVRDLLGCLNTTALARRAFREIARVAGLVFPGFPGRGQAKSLRQIQGSSDLFFDVFGQFDPDNLLLDQARREVLDRELEITRLRQTLTRLAASRLRFVDSPRLTPLSFPLWAESIRTHSVSTERWIDRVKRMVVQLEREAAEPQSRAGRLAASRRTSKRRSSTQSPPSLVS